ncbi:MAG: ribosome small subunit-dependent GTPase A [Calditrichota bacterium]
MTASLFKTGKVLTSTRKTYIVLVEGERITCTLRGKLASKKSRISAVKVGDNVDISLNPEPDEDIRGVIEKVYPRKSQLSRTIESRSHQEQIIAVNIDQLLIILSARSPAFKLGTLDRYLVIAEKNRLKARICLNKIDLAEKAEFQRYAEYYRKIGYPFHFTSAETLEGIAELEAELRGTVSAIVGHSGVGKSSLIKAIAPELDIRLGEVSERTNKGMHTTTAAELYPLPSDIFVIDTPGVRELGLWEIYKRDLSEFFCDIYQLSRNCRFADCQHIHEPGCAVKEAVEAGDFLPERYENYISIYNSLKMAHYE